MEIKLSQPFAPNSAVAPFDVLQVKKGLNRLGYYTPLTTTGITDIPDTAIFSALKKFQKDFGLAVTGIMNPDDATLRLLNLEIAKTPKGNYIWRTVGDGKVRKNHAVLSNTIRAWSDSPDPGEDFGCRCWAESISNQITEIYDPPIEPVYPELLLIPMLRAGKLYNLWKNWTNNKDTEWELGKFKSETKWGNQLRNRDWTPDQISETIKNGKKYPAPNKVNPKNTAKRYEYKDRYVVRDEVTKEILQVSGKEFLKNTIK